MYNPIKTFEHIKDTIYSLEKLLSDNELKIETNSLFEDIYLLAGIMDKDKFSATCLDLGFDEDEAVTYIMGTYHIAQLANDLSHKAGFDEFKNHLKILGISNFVQNYKSSISDSGSNKILELLFGLGAFAVGENIKLDHPENSKGDNPDILVDLKNNRWGFACKVLNSDNPKTLYDNIDKAVDQIENSNADLGIPVLNYKNKFPYSVLLPKSENPADEKRYLFFKDPKVPVDIVLKYIHSRVQEMQNKIGEDLLLDLFAGKKALPGVIVLNQHITTTEYMGDQIYSLNTFLQLVPFNSEAYWDEHQHTLSLINDSFHNIYE